MLKKLKSLLTQEEEALTLLKNQYPLIADKSDAEILSYFELERSEIVAFSKDFKNLYEETKHHPLEQNTICKCTDANNQPKNLYNTREEAEKTRFFLKTSQNTALILYPCPHTTGWHLSKG